MADPLSIAAAGAGFISVAGQLADGIVKLQGLYTTIKNAPHEIQALCDELDMFRGLLEEAGWRSQQSISPGVDISHLKDAFAHCEKTRSHVESVSNRPNMGVSKCRMAILKYPFKKKEVQDMLLSVERGKTSLPFARQSFES